MPTIVLNESHAAKSFKKGNIIHEVEMDRAQLWIGRQLNEADEARKSQSYTTEVQARTITILGSRGSGKTSFMRSLMERYQEEKVQIIQLIDPTLIEEKGHPFLIILSEVNRLVRAQLDKGDNVSRRPAASREACWEKALEKLAEGLPSLEPIGTNYAQWEDAEYVMEKGLSRVTSARGLAENFHALLGLALDILDKRAFLIALDDIDIDFLKGWPVLETLRRYLQTPLLITLLSGDLRLYSKAIRKQQWKNFGKALLKNEAEGLRRMPDYDTLVTDMEGQYLQKVLPSLYRIHLGSLQEKRQRLGEVQRIKVSFDEVNAESAVPIEECYRHYLKVRLGIGNHSFQEPYLSFLLGLPLRTQIRLLSVLASPERYGGETPWLDILLSELYVLRVDVDLIRSVPASLLQEMLRYLQRYELLGQAYLFQPSLQSAKYDAGLFALSTTYAQYSSQAPHFFFEYLIRIGLPYQLDAVSILSDSRASLRSYRYFSLEMLMDYALAQDQSLTDTCGSITAYLYSLDELAGINRGAEVFRNAFGVLALRGLASKSRGNETDNTGRIDHELRGCDPIFQSIAYLPVTISQEQEKQITYPAASFYQLLAAIGELLRRYKLELEEKLDINEASACRIVGFWLRELGTLRSYMIPDLRNARLARSPLDESIEDEEDLWAGDRNPSSELLVTLYWWLRNSSLESHFLPHLMGRIASRLRRSQGNIPRVSLGQWMHRNVILFFNAVLIETTAESDLDIELNKDNAVQQDSRFRDNLRKFSEEKPIPEVARWIFCCPLLRVFLDPQADLALPDGTSMALEDNILFGILSRVLPFGESSSNIGDATVVVTAPRVRREPVLMRTQAEVRQNLNLLLRLIDDAEIQLTSRDDLTTLPIAINWGGKYKRQRMDAVFLEYQRRYQTTLDTSEQDGHSREDGVDN